MRSHSGIWVCIALCCIVTEMQSQTTFRYGPEFGLSISRFAENKSYVISERNDRVTETKKPILGPLVGITTDLTVKKYFYFTAGLQYQLAGSQSHNHRYANEYNSGLSYTTEQWLEFRYQKWCLPVGIGFTVKIGKFQPSVFMGYRFNYFVKGRYYRKFISDYASPEDDYEIVYDFDPFVHNPGGSGFPRMDRQRFCGISTFIGEHFKLSLTVNKGGSILNAEHPQSDIVYGYRNNDYLLSMAWQFSPKTKRKSNIISFPVW
jgi:hypothetical protein